MSRLLKLLLVAAAAVGLRRVQKGSEATRERQRAAEPPEQESSGLPWKRWLKETAAILVLLGVVGLLVAASGIIPITASSGHWPITKKLLSFSMSQSVSFHTIGKKAPPLDSPQLVLRGAGHFETGCRPCHGSPSLKHPRVPHEMTAHPPYLPPDIPKWEPEELFYIVKHGVKFTGMPAYPAREREDEIWAIVAFLQKLPELDAAEYQALARGNDSYDGAAPVHRMLGPQDVPPAVEQSCARCHGLEGLGREDAFPILAGQRPTYLYYQLQSYAHGRRPSGMMEPQAAGLSDEEMRELARYFASRERPVSLTRAEAPPRLVERGEQVARRGVPGRGVASCVDCHGPGSLPRNPAYPTLAGQPADYLTNQLELFKSGVRGGSPYAHLMEPITDRMTKEDMEAVAAFYASLGE